MLGLYPTIGSDYRCAAGVCTNGMHVDCSKLACPASCTGATPGCFSYDDMNVEQATAQCWCVQGTHACQMQDAGTPPPFG